MKNIITLLLMVCFVVVATAQERTVYLNNNKPFDAKTYHNFSENFGASDYLIPTTRDTIDFILTLSNWEAAPQHFFAVVTSCGITGTDTTYGWAIAKKEYANDTWADIVTGTSAVNPTTGIYTEMTTFGVTGYEIATGDSSVNSTTPNACLKYTMTNNVLLHYRYLRLRVIIKGNDSVGTGIKIQRLEINW